MARAEETEEARGASPEGDGVPYADVSDARLAELLRARTATAYPALRELRRRHHARVLGYAGLCAAGEASARQLTAEAFTGVAKETARGVEPAVPWRLHLLRAVLEKAAEWACDERSRGVDPGLLLVLSTVGRVPGSPMLTAYQGLPSRMQGLIWYGVVEERSAHRTALLLGMNPADVPYATTVALKNLAQASLRHRLAASPDPDCPDFRRLIEESVRPDSPRHSADLHAHMTRCGHCTAAHQELCDLRDTPRTALAEGLLGWAGSAYVREAEPEPAAGDAGLPQHHPWRPSRRVALASTALGVALAPLLVLLLTPGQHTQRASHPVTPTAVIPTPPAPTSASPTPTPTPSPSPTRTSASPTPSPVPRKPSPTPTPAPKPRPTPSTAPVPPGAVSAQVVNAATGRCLDVRDGWFDRGTDVVTAPCTSSPTQRWRYDAGLRALRNSADPDFCLDSRGEVGRGVGIWTCSSLYGRNGDNLRFDIDSDGVIRPAVAPWAAVTADGYGVRLADADRDADQRWRAGAR
ncbi:ricin-type beta-trefoil lectin domain protein [Streptomyces sp. NPDC057386]|uniref:ricin-type beta-trefoil lectin domain protein n=1 Tax=unclassified Streptomyces TaxID=2593676 RepID=UPI0036417178